ncbi:MAG: glycosyltransferase, partial [Verrucomicrobiota bacterium]
MKVGYVTHYDARDIKPWSGTGYYISECLKLQGVDVFHVGSLQQNGEWLQRLKHRFYPVLAGRNYLAQVEPTMLKGFARQTEAKLREANVDLIVTPHPYLVGYLRTEKPIVIWADCTFQGMVDFYPYYFNLCKETIRNGNRVEQAAFDRCQRAVFASDWALESARRHYGLAADKGAVVPYGANIVCNRKPADIDEFVAMRGQSPCKLLFLGKIWERKGGKIAVQVAERLNAAGLETELLLVGCQPPPEPALPPCAKVLGFIDKS